MSGPTLLVNLRALRHNYGYFRANLRPETRLMAMIKADAYGVGAVHIARALEEEGIDYFAVARTHEAVELRKAGMLTPIMVMLADTERLEILPQFNIEPEIYSIELLEGVAALRQKLKIHLKFNTGMNRSGMEMPEIALLKKILAENPQLEVISTFTHLASTPMPQHDRFTMSQVAQFRRMYEALGIPSLQHVLNSNGILRFPQYQFEMVRLGIGLYGAGVKGAPLQNVTTFKTNVLQVRNVAPGETVGYERAGKILHPARIATVNAGYADGLSRKLGNGRHSLLVNGKKAPIVGIVCMDMCMIDVTEIPGVREGDEVIIFGDETPVGEVAKLAGTTPYVILTSISKRTRREYVEGYSLTRQNL